MHPIRPLLLTACLWPAFALAQQTQPARSNYPDWDQLSPAQRETIIAPLRERWNRSPETRERMFERARRWQTMPPEQRERAQRGMQRFEQMPEEKRQAARALFRNIRDMSPEQRKAFLAEWRQKTPQQRQEWLQAHPVPEHAQRPRKPGR